MVFYLDQDSCELLERTRDEFRSTYAHEMGHVLGFAHVSDPGALMNRSREGNEGVLRFTLKEQRHMRNAYRLGRFRDRTGAWPGLLPRPGEALPPRIEPESGWIIDPVRR